MDKQYEVVRSPGTGHSTGSGKLLERHGTKLAKDTVRKVLLRAWELAIEGRARLRNPRQPRARRDCLGELVQIDG